MVDGRLDNFFRANLTTTDQVGQTQSVVVTILGESTHLRSLASCDSYVVVASRHLKDVETTRLVATTTKAALSIF